MHTESVVGVRIDGDCHRPGCGGRHSSVGSSTCPRGEHIAYGGQLIEITLHATLPDAQLAEDW